MTLSTLSGRVRDHGRQLASQNSAFQLYQGRCPMISSSVGGIMVTATDRIKKHANLVENRLSGAE